MGVPKIFLNQPKFVIVKVPPWISSAANLLARAFAASELALPDLQAWDTAFASERLREARYAYSENEVKQYFQEPRVLAGLFRVGLGAISRAARGGLNLKDAQPMRVG